MRNKRASEKDGNITIHQFFRRSSEKTDESSCNSELICKKWQYQQIQSGIKCKDLSPGGQFQFFLQQIQSIANKQKKNSNK